MLSKKSNPELFRTTIDEDYTTRVTQQEISRTSSQYAPVTTRTPTTETSQTTTEEQDRSTEERLQLIPQQGGSSIYVGQLRSRVYDQQITTDLVSAQETLSAASTAKAQQDAKRAIQKIQKNCHHQYSASTSRCVLCNKHRSSMIYDA